MKKAIALTAMFVVLTATLSRGQHTDVRIAFDGGRVTLQATGALVGDVLAEWARVGGTVITGADRLPPAKVTVNLVAVDEKSAIEAVIGSTMGYGFTTRSDAPAGSSLMNRLMIVPTTTSAAAPAREIDASLPEVRFTYPAPIVDDPELLVKQTAVRPPSTRNSAAPTEPPPMPEAIFQYVQPVTIPLPSEGDPKAPETPKKKSPSGD